MNKCDKFENLISLYLDDMLLNSEIEELLEHLDSCNHCHDYYADLKLTKDNLKNLKIEYPTNLSQSILDQIQQNKEVQIVQYTPPKRKVFYGLLATCACLAIVISSSGFIFSSTNFGSTNSDTTTSLTTSTTTMAIERSTSTSTSPQEGLQESSQQSVSPMTIDGASSNDIPVADTFSLDSAENTLEAQDAVDESAVEPETSQSPIFSNADLLSDDYAFVFEFEGTENIDDITGKILYYDENLIYLEVENTISLIESVVTTLENNQYELMQIDQNDYRISSEATNGIFIIHKN